MTLDSVESRVTNLEKRFEGMEDLKPQLIELTVGFKSLLTENQKWADVQKSFIDQLTKMVINVAGLEKDLDVNKDRVSELGKDIANQKSFYSQFNNLCSTVTILQSDIGLLKNSIETIRTNDTISVNRTFKDGLTSFLSRNFISIGVGVAIILEKVLK